jgi:NAD(P)-dependent dehydrogenase (short-subunit alcohol dehydrogenase family)
VSVRGLTCSIRAFRAAIVKITSVSGMISNMGRSAYRASKAGLNVLTMAWPMSLAQAEHQGERGGA